MVIGRRGQSIRDLTKVLEEKFHIENPQLSVANIEVPEQDPKVVASQVSQALQRGVHFRRAAYWAIQRVMESQALGVEITIRGKLTTERSRYEKFKAGYLPRVGEPLLNYVKEAVQDIQLKQGRFGIKVRTLPPNIDVFDHPVIKAEIPQIAAAIGDKPVATETAVVASETATGEPPSIEEKAEDAAPIVIEAKEKQEEVASTQET